MATGSLEWSIKLSLLLYVTSAPGGRLVPEGVTSRDGRFFFPADPTRTGEPDDGYAFSGSVALFAHHGAPITTFAALHLRPGLSDRWVLEMSPDGGDAVAAFDLGVPHDRDDVREFTDVTLTDVGSEMFGGYYAPGESFDPIRVPLTSR